MTMNVAAGLSRGFGVRVPAARLADAGNWGRRCLPARARGCCSPRGSSRVPASGAGAGRGRGGGRSAAGQRAGMRAAASNVAGTDRRHMASTWSSVAPCARSHGTSTSGTGSQQSARLAPAGCAAKQ
jgi:hypothetical protein